MHTFRAPGEVRVPQASRNGELQVLRPKDLRAVPRGLHDDHGPERLEKQLGQLEADRDGALKYKGLNERLATARAQLAYKNQELIEGQSVSRLLFAQSSDGVQ